MEKISDWLGINFLADWSVKDFGLVLCFDLYFISKKIIMISLFMEKNLLNLILNLEKQTILFRNQEKLSKRQNAKLKSQNGLLVF